MKVSPAELLVSLTATANIAYPVHSDYGAYGRARPAGCRAARGGRTGISYVGGGKLVLAFSGVIVGGNVTTAPGSNFRCYA